MYYAIDQSLVFPELEVELTSMDTDRVEGDQISICMHDLMVIFFLAYI